MMTDFLGAFGRIIGLVKKAGTMSGAGFFGSYFPLGGLLVRPPPDSRPGTLLGQLGCWLMMVLLYPRRSGRGWGVSRLVRCEIAFDKANFGIQEAIGR